MVIVLIALGIGALIALVAVLLDDWGWTRWQVQEWGACQRCGTCLSPLSVKITADAQRFIDACAEIGRVVMLTVDAMEAFALVMAQAGIAVEAKGK